jgi:hypothetical protein
MATVTASMRTTTMMHSNYINIRNHIYAYLSCNSCRAVEATQRHASPWNIDMIFMDWMCYNTTTWGAQVDNKACTTSTTMQSL